MLLKTKIYLAVLVSTGLWCAAIVSAPLLRVIGASEATVISNALYFALSKICHQLDDRSLHIAGAKFGVCIRCSSIYFSFFVGLLVFPLIRSMESKSRMNLKLLAMGVLPMALDALCNDLGIHASSDVSRLVTGTLAGFILAFLMLPLLVEALTQIVELRKLQGDTRHAAKAQ
jgi:uncharacterized membrane protein